MRNQQSSWDVKSKNVKHNDGMKGLGEVRRILSTEIALWKEQDALAKKLNDKVIEEQSEIDDLQVVIEKLEEKKLKHIKAINKLENKIEGANLKARYHHQRAQVVEFVINANEAGLNRNDMSMETYDKHYERLNCKG